MIFQLTAKNCQILDKSRSRIDRHLAKLAQSLPNVESDLVVLRLTIRKNIDKYYPPRVHHHRHKLYADLKPELSFFEGSMVFCLKKVRFYTHFKGQTIDECTNLGFKHLFTELEKFKDSHFSSQSEYPNHRSIRRDLTDYRAF